MIDRVGISQHQGTLPQSFGFFSQHFQKLRDSYYQEHAKAVSDAVEHFLMFVSDGKNALSDDDKKQAEIVLENLTERFGYTESSARDIVRALAKARYSDAS